MSNDNPQFNKEELLKELTLKQVAQTAEHMEAIHGFSSATLDKLNDVEKAIKDIPEPKDPPTSMEVSIKGIQTITIKGDKGDKGDKGETGSQGKQGERGIKGETGLNGKDGEDGKDGKQGPQGPKGDKGNDGKNGKDGTDGANGENGSPDTPADIVEKINSLPDNMWSPKIDASHIKNLPQGGSAYNERRGGAAGHTIKNAGTALTTRTGLNFLAPLVATDDAAGDETEISLDSDITTEKIGITLDGQGGVISTGLKGFLEIPYAGTITGWTLVADQSGSIVIDVWKDTYANFPPTVADTIAGTEKPTLSSVQKNQDLTLTSWTTAVTAGDILAFNVDSASTVTRVNLIIRITKG